MINDIRYESSYSLDHKLLKETIKMDFEKSGRISPIINTFLLNFEEYHKNPLIIERLIQTQKMNFLKKFKEEILAEIEEENQGFHQDYKIFLDDFKKNEINKEKIMTLLKFFKKKFEKFHKFPQKANKFIQKSRVECPILEVDEEEIEIYELDELVENYNNNREKSVSKGTPKKKLDTKEILNLVEESSKKGSDCGNLLEKMREEINSESMMSPPQRVLSGVSEDNKSIRNRKFFEPIVHNPKNGEIEEINLAVSDDIDEEIESSDVPEYLGKRKQFPERKKSSGESGASFGKKSKKKKLKFL